MTPLRTRLSRGGFRPGAGRAVGATAETPQQILSKGHRRDEKFAKWLLETLIPSEDEREMIPMDLYVKGVESQTVETMRAYGAYMEKKAIDA